nr:TMV resistance protein N-like isoform X2 [Ipomoea batatas]
MRRKGVNHLMVTNEVVEEYEATESKAGHSVEIAISEHNDSDRDQCRMVSMLECFDAKVVRLLYTNSGVSILALSSDGIQKLWNWPNNEQNPTGKHSATGENVSLCNTMTFKVSKTITLPSASTFLAFDPHDDNIIAIGTEKSTIYIYDRIDEELNQFEEHHKPITGLAFSTNLKLLISSDADAQLCSWNTRLWKKKRSVRIQLPAGEVCSGDTHVMFHVDQLHLLVTHETQLAIYDASKMERINQWIPHGSFSAPISSATYSCNGQLIYASFKDGNIGVFDAHRLRPRCSIAPSAYLSPVILNRNEGVYAVVIASHPQEANQLALGLTDGSVKSAGEEAMPPQQLPAPASRRLENAALSFPATNSQRIFTPQRSSWSRSAEITMSAELIMNEFELNDNDVVVVVSLPQRRTRKKKQLIASIPDFAPEKLQGERRVWNLNKRVGELRSEIGGVMATRSSSVNTNSHSVFLKPEPFLSLYFFPCISISLSLSMMYYERFIQVHREKDADITVAEMSMDEKHVIAFGLMKICEEGRNIELAEKPKGEQLKAMKVDTTILGLDDEAEKSLHDAFYVVRCLVNKRFLTAGGERLPQDSPQLYWLWITFFAVDVFFVVIRVAVACIIGIAVCCYLPCIIAILYAVADQEGATGRIQANMSPEVPLNENLADFLSQAASLMPAFMDSTLDTFPVGHSVLTGAADPGEVLALKVKDTLNAFKEH